MQSETPAPAFDHHAQTFADNPFEISSALRETCPVAWTDAHGGFWVISRHDEVARAFRDHATFSSASGVTIPDLSFGTTHIPVTVDPPDLLTYRKLLTPVFSKEATARREDDIRAAVRAVVEDLASRGTWDFVTDLADVMPGTVMMMVLGMDPDRRSEFSAAMASGMGNQATDDESVKQQMADDRAWLLDQIQTEITQRREHRSDDVLSYLVHEPLGTGQTLTDQEIVDVVMVLFVAGFHTTSGALSAVLVHLARHLDQREMLMADRSLIPAAIEEVMRVYPPATAMARTVTNDVEFGGATMAGGDKALLMIMSANRDPRIFAGPDQVDLDRDERGSLAFGWGVHRCLGIHLARMLLCIELDTLFDVIPDYSVHLDDVELSAEIGIGYVHSHVPASR